MTNRSTLLAASALAALTLSGLARPAEAQAINGLYIGAGAGVNLLEQQRFTESVTSPFVLNSNSTSFNQDFNTGFVAAGSVGYGLGNGLRFEVEGSYRNNRENLRRFVAQVSHGGHEQKYGVMANALYDIDPALFGFLPLAVTPYFGAGIGYQWAALQGQANAIVPPNLNEVIYEGGTRGSLAVQGILGLSIPISAVPGLAVTAEYRFMALTDSRTYAGPITAVNTVSNQRFVGRFSERTTEDYNHSFLLGVRYAFNTVRPLVIRDPDFGPGPSTAARTYLVFFDWDRADLTDRARAIIAEAARATQQVQTTRIMVSGNTDTTGTAGYNQGLSVRRAQNVAAQLVRDGVPRSAISTQGFGFSRLLVPTGPGVREPQNRRVEIVLQ